MNLHFQRRLQECVLFFFACFELVSADHRGLVKFGSLPLPGASVTVTQDGKRRVSVTDLQGRYRVDDIGPGTFEVDIEMQLFAPSHRVFADATPMAEWDLELLKAEELAARVGRAAASTAKTSFPTAQLNATKVEPRRASAEVAREPDPAAIAELAQRAADGFLVNGSVNNGATSPFSQLPAFGNDRRKQRSLYNGNLGVIVNNARFDARSFSLTGQDTIKPEYSRLQGLVSFGGPIRIPGLMRKNGPNFTVNYQWTRNSNATTQTGLVPTIQERAGNFLGPITDPLSGNPFPSNAIPESRISPQARVLLQLYPQANFAGNSRYNFQLPIVSGYHQDDLQTRANKQVRRNFYSGTLSWQNTRTDSPSLFGFLDTGRINGINTTSIYRRTISQRAFVNTTLSFSRLTTRVNPYFANRRDVSGEAGITGNSREAINWGPPNLNFSTGINSLSAAAASLLRNQTAGIAVDLFYGRNGHNLQTGVNLRRQQFNVDGQKDPRGTLAFTGEAAGNDFAGFLLGIPDTSSIAFGNADKYLRGRISEAFLSDDWRLNPSLTINAGLRWEYWSPVSEKYNRLVNLDIAPAFVAVVPDNTVPRPDRNNFAPRVALAWRPVSASSMIVRAGYGVYYDTSIYQPIAIEMAQQAPLSKSLRVANNAATPLTLANPFVSTGVSGQTTFAVDPNLRTGYAHTWQLTVQRDLPAGMQINATYNGGKGTRAQQQVLPNTFPGASLAPAGYTYLLSNGNSTRHSGLVQVRRRLRSGFTAQFQYTWAKSLDNALLGGRGRAMIAQNWLDLSAERGRSNFDQRHLIGASFQYTIGMGLRGGGLMRGWRAAMFKEWTMASTLNWGTGLPLTPIYVGAVAGTGVTGSLRPDYTGAPLYDAPAGFSLNPAAYTIPSIGQWGNAGRNSINGPGQCVINSSIGRTFRSSDRVSLDLRIDASNMTNTPTFPSWNTIAGNAQFGLPNATSPMRSVQSTVRMRF